MLARLREAPCSGAELSHQLGVSRAQVWKHVESLRARGYVVEGEPGGGYRLVSAPDRLYPEEVQAGLETRWLARDLRWFESIDSTNRVAGDLGREGAAHGTTVVAESQTQGRGRLGRSFYSPAGTNLYSSSVLRPALTLQDAPTTVLVAAVAVAETLAAELGSDDDVSIKWPNDVQLGGRKVCGILMELTAEATRVGHLVLGIGVNLNVDAADFPEEFRARATSVATFRGAPVDRKGFARRLYGTLEDVLDLHAERGFGPLRPRFDRWFHMRTRRIRVSDMDGTETEGTALGIDTDGALLLDTGAAQAERVLAGDVTVLDTSAPGARP